MYLDALLGFINGHLFARTELSVDPKLEEKLRGMPLSENLRTLGEDWPGFAMAMTGRMRCIFSL